LSIFTPQLYLCPLFIWWCEWSDGAEESTRTLRELAKLRRDGAIRWRGERYKRKNNNYKISDWLCDLNGKSHLKFVGRRHVCWLTPLLSFRCCLLLPLFFFLVLIADMCAFFFSSKHAWIYLRSQSDFRRLSRNAIDGGGGGGR
jgi:hypothetical protein